MHALHSLLSFLFKLAIALMLLSFVIWLVGLFVPTFKLKNILSFSTSGDWLPAPGSWGVLTAPKVPSAYDNVYTPTNFVTYTQNGNTAPTQNLYNQNFNSTVSSYTERSLYIRNLSIFDGGHVYTGLSFTGEARDTMFSDGKFPILIADPSGKVVSVVLAEATSNWSIPGWVRFKTKVNMTLPNKVPCTMVFQSATTYQGKEPVRIMIPILCN